MTSGEHHDLPSVLMTGATGFLGREIVWRLWQSGIRVLGIIRRPAEVSPFIPVPCDLTDDTGSLPEMPETNCTALIHLAGHYPGGSVNPQTLHERGTARAISIARQWNVDKIIYVSAYGAALMAPSGFQQSKWAAEEIVSHSGLKFTILRPHLMVGAGSPSLNWLTRQGKLPMVALRPVHVADVAETVIRALWMTRTEGKRYELAGPQLIPLPVLAGQHSALGLLKRRLTEQQLERIGISALRGGFVDGSWISDFGLLPRSPIAATGMPVKY
ncbi:MAG: NAD(P)H-binding protein [Firmicutes bacterium]|nr:NAD(P)H-binding protein [Bacillota bacterium]